MVYKETERAKRERRGKNIRMFYEIDTNKYIYIHNISAVSLEEEEGRYFWLFYTNHPSPLKSMYFQTKEEAIVWFRNLKYTVYRVRNENI